MNNLTGFSEKEIPLGQSLFWMLDNEPQSTWPWLSRNWTNEKRQKMYGKLETYKQWSGTPSWTAVFLIYHMADPECVCNPFLGCPTAQQVVASGGGRPDDGELSKWQHLLSLGQVPGVNLIPCLYCGDDKATLRNGQFISFFTPLATQFLAPYSKAICICSEPPKNASREWQEWVIGMVKSTLVMIGRSDMPVVTHLQGEQIITQLPRNADAVLYQFNTNPVNAHLRNIEDVEDEGRWALSTCPIPLCFFELAIQAERPNVREMSRRLKAIPGCLMLPGPA